MVEGIFILGVKQARALLKHMLGKHRDVLHGFVVALSNGAFPRFGSCDASGTSTALPTALSLLIVQQE